MSIGRFEVEMGGKCLDVRNSEVWVQGSRLSGLIAPPNNSSSLLRRFACKQSKAECAGRRVEPSAYLAKVPEIPGYLAASELWTTRDQQ